MIAGLLYKWGDEWVNSLVGPILNLLLKLWVFERNPILFIIKYKLSKRDNR